MTARENALRIINFDSPERIVGWPPCHDISYYGCDHDPLDGAGGHHSPVGTRWKDVWGVGWHLAMEGVMGYAELHPLASLDLAHYRWPDPEDPRLLGRVYERARSADRDGKLLFGRNRDTLWERAYMLVGMDALMVAFHEQPEAVRELLHRITDFQLAIACHYVACGVEIVLTGDDLGGQRGLLFSRQTLEEFFVPEYRRLFDYYRRHGVIIMHHSCGAIEPLIDLFMTLGVRVLNPVQASANDLASVRRATQDRMALQGGVSSALIMEGPVERIEQEVRRCMWLLGRDGGYFCGPDQGLPFPEEHRRAMDETIERYGAYPLQPVAEGW